jgi:Nucleolar protein 12 (25kDa)
MSSKSRAQQTAAKRAREQRLKERRAMKDQKRRERKEAATEAAAAPGLATDEQRAKEGDAGGELAATGSSDDGDGQPVGPATTGSIMNAMRDE